MFAAAGDLSGIAVLLGDMSLAALARDDRPRAVRLAGAATQLVASGGVDLGTLIDEIENRTPESIGNLADPTLAAALAEGKAMSVEAAVADALAWLASVAGET